MFALRSGPNQNATLTSFVTNCCQSQTAGTFPLSGMIGRPRSAYPRAASRMSVVSGSSFMVFWGSAIRLGEHFLDEIEVGPHVVHPSRIVAIQSVLHADNGEVARIEKIWRCGDEP